MEHIYTDKEKMQVESLNESLISLPSWHLQSILSNHDRLLVLIRYTWDIHHDIPQNHKKLIKLKMEISEIMLDYNWIIVEINKQKGIFQ